MTAHSGLTTRRFPDPAAGHEDRDRPFGWGHDPPSNYRIRPADSWRVEKRRVDDRRRRRRIRRTLDYLAMALRTIAFWTILALIALGIAAWFGLIGDYRTDDTPQIRRDPVITIAPDS